MTSRRCGAAIVVDADQHLLGIFTDGDFRRQVEKDIGVMERRTSCRCSPLRRLPLGDPPIHSL